MQVIGSCKRIELCYNVIHNYLMIGGGGVSGVFSLFIVVLMFFGVFVALRGLILAFYWTLESIDVFLVRKRK